MTGYISQKIDSIRQQIPQNVRLIAITKQVSVEAMREAYATGIRDFGENRLQEALSKQEQLQDLKDIDWHFIGHIQKNKAKKIIENFTWIHSVDSLALAKRLNRLAEELNRESSSSSFASRVKSDSPSGDRFLRRGTEDRIPKVFLQVKVLPDPNKYGWEVTNLLQDLPQLSQYQYLNFQGLMTILPLGLSPTEVLGAFQKTKQLATTIEQKGYANLTMKELSMGMSGDYMQAIEAGATMIRLGRTIFGERNK